MLKKFTILLFFYGFMNNSISGQNFGGGISLGLSTSQVGGDNLGGFNKAGILVGFFTNKSFSEIFSLQIEMTYIQKGSNNTRMNDYDHVNYQVQDITSSYIEVPLIIQYHQSNKLKIEGGLQAAYLIDAYYKDINGEIPKNGINPFIKYDFGVLFGIDYKYSENISINTRLSNSILPIGSEDYENQSSYNYLRKGKFNSVLSFAIHYNI